MHRNSSVSLAALILAATLVAPGKAHAYLDPGSGSYFYQILIASLLGGGYLLRTHWARVKGFVLHLLGRDAGESGDDPAST